MGMSVPGNSCSSCRSSSSTSGCILRLSGECVYYSGSNVSGPGINTADNLNVTINKLAEYISGAPGAVTSVGLTMPFGFTVTGSPVTSSGTLAVTAFNEWVSVTDYGATANGTTDDTVNIQAALDSGAKTILFPQGTYLITNILRVNSNTTIIGYGATLFRGADINVMLLNNSNGTIGGYDANENIEVYGLSFNGNKANFPNNAGLLAIGHAKKIVVKDCKFYNVPGAWHGIELNGVRDSLVEGCYFYNGSTSEQLQLDLMASSATFPLFGPYDNTYCEHIIINGNVFSDSAYGVGSHSGSDPNQHRDIVISNNTFRNLTQDAIRSYNYRNLVITGNTIDGCNNGIASFLTGVTGVQNWTISNNSISNTLQGGINIFYINGLTITGNSINATTRWGMFVGNSNNVVITGNTVKDASQHLTTDYAAIDIAACVNVYVANNVALKSSAGLASGTNTIKTSTSPFGGSINTNITIENNTTSTPGTTTVFNFAGTNTNFIVGMNTINTKITPFISTKTTDYIYTPTDGMLNVDTSLGNVTITINPVIFNKAGLIVRKTTADINTVIIAPSSGTINGVASITLTSQNETASIKSDWINLDAIITP